MKSRLFKKEKWIELNNKWFRFSKKGTLTAVGNLATYLVLIAFSVIFLAPFFYMIGHSVMSPQDLADMNVEWLPRSFELSNYSNAVKVLDYFPRLMWSLLIAGLAVAAQIFSCSLVGYGVARIKFRGSGLAFALIIFGMLIPPQTIITTQYITYAQFGLLDTPVPLILPGLFSLGLNGGLFVFLFRQFFKSMPKELENAALIDGTGIFGAYFRIMLPNASSAMLVTLILSFIWQWNNYFEPSLYIRDQARYTLVMMLSNLSATAQGTLGTSAFNNGVNLAATFLCALPLIIVFFILQKRFIKGIETSGLAN